MGRGWHFMRRVPEEFIDELRLDSIDGREDLAQRRSIYCGRLMKNVTKALKVPND
jgi:hypothetical protein